MTETHPVHMVRDAGVAVIVIDNPPVNALSQAVRQGVARELAAALADAEVTAIVIACDGRTFCAGADIREFGKPPAAPILPEVLAAIETAAKPVVAALHGTAMGGGFEVALACHARVIDTAGSVGLPEVKLGIVPGAGGTQRLPRLVGVPAALDIITSGRSVRAGEAMALGIVDAVAEGDVRAAAIAHARTLAGAPPRTTLARPVPAFDAAELDKAMAAVARRARGQLSPVRAAELVKLAGAVEPSEGLARERATFVELLGSPQAAALRHVFFAEREVGRIPRLDGVAPRPVARVGVIGGGTMGAGIAVAFADAGLPVVVTETSIAAVGAARDRIAGLWDRQVKSGRITQDARDRKLSLVTITDDFDALADVDLAVEAAFEDMAVKADIFGRLGRVAKPGAVLATNTSALDVDAIAAASGRPGDVIGLHFFSPANVMRLVEVVEGTATAPDALATGLAVAKRLGKLAVPCGNCDGFVGNRILAVWRNVAEFAVEDGAMPHEVDAAIEAFGFPMGPFAVSDLAGLDIGWARRKRLAPTRDPAMRYASTVADRLCEAGRFGQKTGAGWYRYVDGRREIDPEVTDLVERVSREKGIARRPIPQDLIQERVHAAMVNEGSRILAEGIVGRPLAIDLVLINGYGYPAWRGGPMFEADARGLGTVIATLEGMAAAYGRGWDPAPSLVELARDGGTFGALGVPAR